MACDAQLISGKLSREFVREEIIRGEECPEKCPVSGVGPWKMYGGMSERIFGFPYRIKSAAAAAWLTYRHTWRHLLTG